MTHLKFLNSATLLLTLCCASAPGEEPAGVSLPKIEPPAVKDGRQEFSLPDAVDEICVGGGGRYLCLYFKALRKIGIFDVNELKITNYVPASGADTRFAAGATKLLVVSGDSGVVSRWDLETAKKELTQSIDLGGSAGYVVMGSASAGPAIVAPAGRDFRGDKMLEIDLQSLKASPFKCESNQRGLGSGSNVRASADGNVLSSWSAEVSPTGLRSYVRSGDEWKSYYQHDSAGSLAPSPDGKLIYTGSGIYTNQLRRVGSPADPRTQTTSIPALHGPYYLTLSTDIVDRKAEKLQLKLEGDERPLATIEGLEKFGSDPPTFTQLPPLDRQLFFIPDAQLILQRSHGNKKLLALHFDAEEALNDSPIDFLLVTSRPPLSVKAGENVFYQLQVKSKTGDVKFSLDAGPEGMELSPAGLLTWETTSKSPAKNNVIISVTDKSEQQVFQTFDLLVTGANANTSATDTDTPATSEPKPPAVVQKTPMVPKATDDDIERFNRIQAERAAQEALKNPPNVKPAPAKPAFQPAFREWTDSTGEHKLTAKFVEIVDRKTVVLQLENGDKRKIPLNKLSEEDLYEAVRSDLLLQEKTKPEVSPFEE